jgi:hypothetical protein
MKRVLAVTILSVFISFCSNDKLTREQSKETTEQKESASVNSTETFSGTADGVKIIFEHTNYTRYRLAEGEKITEGNLNTERGFENDEDATVYILDYDLPDIEQQFFVRMTNGNIMMLDKDRKTIPNSSFAKK